MEIVYWNERVERFIAELDKETKMRARRSIDLLQKEGYNLDMPDSKSLGKGLFELRTHGRRRVRILYMFKNDIAIILHGFVKKSWKISRRDIEYARHLQKEVNIA